MKTFIIFIFMAMYTLSGHSQKTTANLEEGTIVILTNINGEHYKHIDFPRKNFIIKRGALADFNSLAGTKLVIKEYKATKGTNQIALLSRQDDKPFFRFFSSVEANIEQAIESGELKMYLE
ncbi:hypothetical protein [Cellulophaga sp. Z1A5H]|uniref:hypothetical protein n=1 Tax=Cellulophaga sp. Z1A5H TaxID=2687291 RepID=UPI0013FD3731|nr:hypothetical protein [Cellulophaga sp. Z1A5H]